MLGSGAQVALTIAPTDVTEPLGLPADATPTVAQAMVPAAAAYVAGWVTVALPTGEPNDGNDGPDGVAEDCMIIEGDQGGTWDDRPCDPTQVATAGSYAYVCQY